LSRQTLGDDKALQGEPPAPKLTFQGVADAPSRVDYAGPQGIIKDNDFNDDGFAIGGKFAPIAQRPVPPEFRFVDIFAIAHWARNIGKELTGIGEPSAGTGDAQDNAEGIVKGATFIAEQFLLASLNPGGLGVSALGLGAEDSNISGLNAVYNPLAIVASLLPARVYDPDIAPIVAGPLLGGDYKTSLLGKLFAANDLLTIKQQQSPQLVDIPGKPGTLTELLPEVSSFFDFVDAETIGPLDAAFPEEEEGVRETQISDEEIYVPFMFQDLRDDPPKYLYFRAFLKPGISETFTPDWQLNRYYGRVDQVPVYQGTIRTLNVAFDVVAWSPEDLPVMWNKLKKLQSMVYPFYDDRGFMKSGPIIRMRIGDLIAGSDNKGLPGYITSMDWSYDDGIWNIAEDARIPRKVAVSIGYTVLHDGNPGTYPNQEADIAPDGSEVLPTIAGSSFGAAKFTGAGSDSGTTIKVSPAEIRKIFKSQG
jgi:hypothetical protein